MRLFLRLKSHVTLPLFLKYINDSSLEIPYVSIFISTLYALCIET